MKRHLGIVLLFISVLAKSQYQPVNLQCEYLMNPLGIDNPQPRFSWQLNDPALKAGQSAYEIRIAKDSNALAGTKNAAWYSEKISAADMAVTYAGKALQPFTKYYWQVICYDVNGNSYKPSAINNFETGMLSMKNWKGNWISDGIDTDKKEAPYFRKKINVSKKIKAARLYIVAAGLYELSINGEKIGDHFLDPMYTRFDRRNLYITYDVSDNIKSGENAIGVLLGNGWYNHQSSAVWFFDKAPWRNRPAFCLDLKIKYEDGSEETISTDKTWKTDLSPLIFNSIYTAEHYDARKEIAGWNKPDFDDSKWKQVTDRAAPSQNITAQVLHPVREVEKIKPVSMKKFNDTNYVYNIGRNISGISELKVSGAAGTVIRLKHAELLDSSGHADLWNIVVHYRPKDDTDPFQTDIFILKGNGIETFKPRFNYKGFQFVEITSSAPVQLNTNSLTAYFVHSDVPVVGTIKSSNELINKIWKATNNAYLSNLMGYPTDCPQREKNGWTGDAHIAIETGLYNFDGFTVYEKWLADHRDEQQPNGVLPAIIPTSGWGYQWANGPDWTSTIAIIPWTLYTFYGDTKPLKDCYDNIKAYVDHINELYPSGITSWGLGDWVPVKSVSPVDLTSSLYYFTDVTILAKAARLFNKTKEADFYAALADKIKNAINKKYLNEATGIYGSGLQTELATPLFWKIVPEHVKQKVADNLAKKVIANGYKLDVGILGAKAILNALSENGYADVAYKLATQTEEPSWGNWIKNGATTLYENWNINAKNDFSLNHIMFGEIGAWLYKGLGGIFPDSEQPGFRHIILKPNFYTGPEEFEASYKAPPGLIKSAWKRKGKKIYYTCLVPANMTATFMLPPNISVKQIASAFITNDKKASALQSSYSLPAGVHQFVVTLQ